MQHLNHEFDDAGFLQTLRQPRNGFGTDRGVADGGLRSAKSRATFPEAAIVDTRRARISKRGQDSILEFRPARPTPVCKLDCGFGDHVSTPG